MSNRRSHYELAFEAYLDRRGTPYVAVEDVRHFVKGRVGVKTFDYIVYPVGGLPCLVDVKGRKSTGRQSLLDCRQKNWVTQADVDGLQTWQEIFGTDFTAQFVFVYWLADKIKHSREDIPVDHKKNVTFAGREYSFWLVEVGEYAQHLKTLSQSWKTVSVPREVFRSISCPLEASWPPAPC